LNKTRSIVKTIILDFSLVAKIDEAGVKTLIKIENEYKNDNVTILFASVNG
jgi:anti-anti-sigma regulatory factor